MIKKVGTKRVWIFLFIKDDINIASPDYAGYINMDPIKWECESHYVKTFNRAGRGICNHFKG